MNTDPPKQLYDALAPLYHLIYEDWEKSIERQASDLNTIIREMWGEGIRSVLDAACGIGTQSLGLAKLEYDITASDLSSAAVERARVEAEHRGLSISFSTVDMREVFTRHARQFDLVLACDNAIPHLLSDDDILEAFRQFYHCTRSSGGCLISVRDYEVENMSEHHIIPYGKREENNTKWIILQVREPRGKTYDVTFYFIRDDGCYPCQTFTFKSVYYAVGIPRLIELMTEAGFVDVLRVDNRFFQPVIVGTRKG